MHNVGGFTDGDRAACLLAALGVPLEHVQFVGYAVDHVGPWSGATDPVRKLDKLKWMERILDNCLTLDGKRSANLENDALRRT